MFDLRNHQRNSLSGTLVGWATRYGWELLTKNPDLLGNPAAWCAHAHIDVVIVDNWLTYKRVTENEDHPFLVVFLSQNADKGDQIDNGTRVVPPSDEELLLRVLSTKARLVRGSKSDA